MNTLNKETMDSLWVFHEDGTLTWKNDVGNDIKRGMTVGCKNSRGYILTRLTIGSFLVHRLVYAYHTGEWPPVIDHINGIKTDNRLSNLRAVSQLENAANSNKIWGKVPYRGVSQVGARYRAEIHLNRKKYHLGMFDTPEEAHEVYLKKREEFYPDFVGDIS